MKTKVKYDAETLNRIRDSKGRFTEAPPYGFKKGQIANPKGGPKSNLTKREKLILLSAMARINFSKANPVEAIKEHNKMEDVYSEAKFLEDNRQYNIFISGGEEAKKKLEMLLGGKLLPKGGEDGQDSKGKDEAIP